MAFDKWPVVEIWHARASCFAFICSKTRWPVLLEILKSVLAIDGELFRLIGDARVRVS